MDPITSGIIAGGVGLAGNFLSSQASSAQAQKQMDFQEQMSNTAHQREVQDLKAAGLNPILSALGGGGASTPGGAMGAVPDFGGSLTSGVKVAQAQQMQNKQLDQLQAQIDNTHADEVLKNQQKGLAETQAYNTQQETMSRRLQNQIVQQTMPYVIKKAKAEGDWSNVNQLLNAINSGASSASKLGIPTLIP